MQYNRILLKLSGESLMGEQKYVPRQGDGEHAVMGGVGNSHRENPLSFEGG